MLRATTTARKGHFREAAVIDNVVLDFEERRRRRGTLTATLGTEFLVDLADVPSLDSGDAFLLENGKAVEVVAAPEPLMEVRARDLNHMVRIAYHLGNRHLEAEIGSSWIRIRRDHVIAEMAHGLGARVIEIEAPFHPEGGAYDHAGAHGHAHEHQAQDHKAQDHKAHDHKAHDHVHGPGCGHDHSHDHGQGHHHGHKHG
jgi:urease accessory protein